MVKVKHDLCIDQELLLHAKNELTISLDDFVEYALSMYLQHEDKYANLFYEGVKHYSELKKIQDKIKSFDNTTKEDENSYDQAMETIRRIHSKLKYIGKNQIREVANNHNLNPNELIRYVESLDEFNVMKFGAAPK